MSLPILITAICWPFAPVLRLEIAPMVEPVLSFTGSPTESAAAAPAVALVSAAEPVGDVLAPVSGEVLVEPDEDDVSGGVCELGAVELVAPGIFELPVVGWLEARA